jgi:ABC-type amino acid transport substrate-binding protein
VKGYEKLNTLNLVPVPQAIFNVDYVFIWLKTTSFDGDPAHLPGLRVGHLSGNRWLEKNLDQKKIKTVPIPHNSPIAELLLRRRFDIFAIDGLLLSRIIAQNPQLTEKIKTKIWKQIPFQHFLTQKHADKIKALNTAAVSAITSGRFDAIYTLPGVSHPEIEE